MNLKTLGWLAAGLCTIGFAGAAARHTPAKGRAVQTSAPAPKADSVTILGYTGIGNGEGQLPPEEFRQQMQKLKDDGMTPVSMADFLSWRAGGKALPEHAVLLTFENADKDFMTHVLPILREFGYPFLLFVDTRCLGSMPGYITERDLGVVSRTGGSVGVCNSEDSPEQEWQQAELRGAEALGTLSESKLAAPARRLAKICGTACNVFSHFSANTDVTILRELAHTGYAAAFSRSEGKATRNSPDFLIPRYMVHGQADFSRALGQAPAAPAPATPAPAHITPGAPLPDLEDDCVAIDDEEDETPPTPAPAPTPAAPQPVQPDQPATPAPAPAPDQEGEEEPEPPLEEIPTTPVTPTYANLGHRPEGGDWVTASFSQPVVPREQTRVAVLGYHNFSNTKSVTDMRMRTHVFCQQMQYIKEAGITVISMQDFLEWRFGNRLLPERCVLITIDDGWKSVYTDAFPILKAYGYPFTIFLYNRYIDVKGDSMTSAQIREMQACGATVGSHSTNHLLPSAWKRIAKDPDAYAAQIQTEILDSGTNLTAKFGPCVTYCYPGGYNTPPMIEALQASPFRVAFTVLEQKVTCKEPPYQVHRYMVFGTDHRIFRRAVNFDGEAGIKPTEEGIAAAEATARAFFPKAYEGIPLPEGQEPAASDPEEPTAEDPDAPDAGTGAAEEAATPAPAPAPKKSSKRKGRKKSKGSR